MSCGQIIKHNHIMMAVTQLPHYMTTDIPRSANR